MTWYYNRLTKFWFYNIFFYLKAYIALWHIMYALSYLLIMNRFFFVSFNLIKWIEIMWIGLYSYASMMEKVIFLTVKQTHTQKNN